MSEKNTALFLRLLRIRAAAAKGVWSRIPGGILRAVPEARFIARNERHWIKPPCNGIYKRWRPGLLRNLQFYTRRIPCGEVEKKVERFGSSRNCFVNMDQ